MKSVKYMTLTAAIGFALVGAGLQSSTSLRAANVAELMATANADNNAVVDGVQKYIITFTEAGLMRYQGGVASLQATAPNKAAGQRKLDVHSMAAKAYEAHLDAQRAVHVAAIEGVLGRALEVTHSYSITLNGVAADLDADEAAKIAAVPGVESVRPAGFQHLDTYRGPTFIGANTIWNGTNTPSHVGSKGKGIVVAILDGGANSTHPSFANTSVDNCGFTTAAPKLIAKDCSTSSGGVCNGPNPEANPTFGHGVHTSSTVAGNTISNADTPSPLLPDGVTNMSGVAPCASIRQYKVCQTNTCGGADIVAGIQNAIADQVDVLNFSISGGTSPWSGGDNDRQFLDAVNADVFVAASAGNTSATVTNPVGQVNHRGPWMMTVAASTQDEFIAPQLTLTGPGTPPGGLSGIALNPGSTSPWGTPPMVGASILTYPTNIEGCTDSGGFPAHYFDGAVALIRRGTCAFSEKIDNAAHAGATMVIIANNQPGTISMDTSAVTTHVSSFSIGDVTTGDALIAFVNAHPPGAPVAFGDDVVFQDGFDGEAPPVGTGATIDFDPAVHGQRQPDVLGDFSFRGPTPGTLADLTKPDITAPGVDIFAALDKENGNYGLMSGTSMSGPHVAGSAALIRAVHPDWTVPEVKSALMMTAKSDGYQENGTTPWNIDDVGSGRVDLTKAALAGLTMNETYANFLAANPTGGTINVKDLNLAALRNMACNGTCTWTRKVKNRLSTSGTWTVASSTDPSFTVTASPATFTLAAGAEQTITFTAAPTTNITAIKFGNVTLHETSNRAPDQHITVALKGTAGGGSATIAVTPASLTSTQAANTTATKTLTIANTGGGTLNWSVATTASGSIWNQPQTGSNGIVSSYSTVDGKGGYTAADFQVAGTSTIKKIKVFGFDNTNTLPAQAKITWRIYSDASGKPSGNPDTNTGTPVWTFDRAPNGAGVSIADSGVITLDLVAAGQNLSLPAGTYWLTVFPTYANAIGPAGSARWNWFQADQQGAQGMLVGSMFGVSNWSGLQGLVGWPDVAFTIDGDVACGASWLSLSPTSGNVSGGGNASVTATFNSNGMTAGTYNATACIASNDTAHPIVTVPVTMTVENGGGSCSPTQLFKDPSLEQMDTFWTATDSVFGDPWCDATCDDAGTVTAHSGDIFAWFGGTATAGTGTLAQSVVFPSGQARWLNFWMIDQLGTQATLKLTIDGTQVTTFPAGTPSQTYARKSFQIPAQYLDGQSHSVKFNYAKSSGSSIAGVMLDDVTLDCSAAPAAPAAPVADAVTASARGRMH